MAAPRKYRDVLTEETLRSLYTKHQSSTRIAHLIGCSHKTVLAYLHEYGIIESNRGRPASDKVGQYSGKLHVVAYVGKDKKGNTLWECLCECGRKHLLNNSHFGRVRSCGCVQSSQQYKGVYSHYLTRIKDGAKARSLEVSVTLEYVGDLLERQDYRCALTGWPIHVHRTSERGKTTASLDRIDSDKGYIEGNIQWIHKDINKMKQDFRQERFLEACFAVCNRTARRSGNEEFLDSKVPIDIAQTCS